MNKRTEEQKQHFRDCITSLPKSSELACNEGCEFSMHQYTHPCGTPSCVLGYLASRTDVDHPFALIRDPDSNLNSKQLYLCWKDTDREVYFSEARFLAWFGITRDQATLLFGAFGCDEAQTPEDAIAYLTPFAEGREADLP